MEKERAEYRIGYRLGEALKIKGMSIVELANATGIDKTALQRFYTNTRCPSLSTIKIIEKGLGVPDGYLTEDATEFLEAGKEQLMSRMANVDTIINLEHGNEKTYKSAIKSIQQSINQIYNSLTPENQYNLIHKYYEFLITDVYSIVNSEVNPKETYWNWHFDNNGLLENQKDSNKASLYYLTYTIRDVVNKFLNADEKKKEEYQDAIFSAVTKLQNLDPASQPEEIPSGTKDESIEKIIEETEELIKIQEDTTNQQSDYDRVLQVLSILANDGDKEKAKELIEQLTKADDQ